MAASCSISMITLSDLPREILEYILALDNISYADLCAVTCTCKRLQDICFSNELWRLKFFQRWPYLSSHYDKGDHYDWKQEYIMSHKCRQDMRKYLTGMSAKYYRQDELSKDAFEDFGTISDHSLRYYFCAEELEHILQDGDTSSNLTDKYYALRVLRHLKHEHLSTEWQAFMVLPLKDQLLEKGAFLLSQWCQPAKPISFTEVANELNRLAKEVQTELVVSFPKHPACSLEIKSPDEILEESLWNPSDCRVLLHTINTILFREKRFTGNRDDFYNALNSYIDQVLLQKQGIPITLCIVYAAIAQRLGILCLPVNFPGNFLLKWKEHPNSLIDQQYTYIDVFGGGRFLSKEACQKLIPGSPPNSSFCYDTAQPMQVFQRMCWNLVEVGRQRERIGDGIMFLQNILELLSLLRPDGVEHKLLQARVYLHLNINLPLVMSILQEIVDQDPGSRVLVDYMRQAAQSQIATHENNKKSQQVTPKLRSAHSHVEYAVGMIMTHKKYNYTCVIFGWDPICAANRDWIFQMGVYNLPNKDKQPFYNVLVEDGTSRYAAQENLGIAVHPKAIPHGDIGKYFQHFRRNHYIPNNEKEAEYPEDNDIREKLVHQAYGS